MFFWGLQIFWRFAYHCQEDSTCLIEEAQKSRQNLLYPVTACLVEIDREITAALPKGSRDSTDSSKFKQKVVREDSKSWKYYLKHRGFWKCNCLGIFI